MSQNKITAEVAMDFRITFSGRFAYRRGGGVSFHNHPEDFQIQIIYGGEADMRIDGQLFHVVKDDVLFIRKGSTHEFTVTSGECLRTLEVKFITSDDVILRMISYIHTYLQDKNGQLFGLFSSIVTEGYQKLFAFVDLSNAMLLTILSLMARSSNSITPYPRIESRAPTIQSQLLQDITQFVSANINRRYTIPELAAECGYNKDYLYRMVKKETGMTAIQYISKLKYDQAKKMIQHTELSLSEIAWNLGFGSLQYFSRFFHEHSGISPSEYMAKVRNTVRTDY